MLVGISLLICYFFGDSLPNNSGIFIGVLLPLAVILVIFYFAYPMASKEFKDFEKAVLKHLPNKDNYYIHKMVFEDEITGTYKDIPFKVADAAIIRRNVQRKYGEYVDYAQFNGLMLAVKLDKNFYKETIVKNDKFKIFKLDKKNPKFEDIEFNKKFKVYTDDEIEARYILTPTFMERLKNFHKNRNDKTIILFDSGCSNSMNMFILTDTGKDNFEIPFDKSILKEKYYYKFLKELVDMLEIAVSLRLEQNIGL
ncbi:MAG: DUF3137 domain-containing protein [bacterium]|nr:DUF3137 domain-containing protein [bacterium]